MYLGNAEQIFTDFMKETHLNDEQFELDGSDIYGSLFSDAHRGQTQKKPHPPANVCVTLECTLEEFYLGSIKTVKYQREQTQPDGRSKVKVDEEQIVEVKPGFSCDTVLTFRGKGN